MAGPVAQEDTGRMDMAVVNTRAVEMAMPQLRANLPRVADTDLQRLAEFALQGNQRMFTQVLAQVAPTADPARTFAQLTEIVNYWKEAAPHIIRYAPAILSGDRHTAEQEMDELGRLRRTGEQRHYPNIGPSILSGVRNEIRDYGVAHNTPPEEIDTAMGDAARGAIGAGFSLGDVMGVFGDFAGAQGDSATNAASAQQFQEMLREAAVTHSENLRNSMRDMQEKINSTTDARKKRQLEEEYRQLLQEYSRLVGGALGSVADRFAKGEEPTERSPSGRTVTINEEQMRQMASDQATLLIRAHMHRPGEYVPVRVPRQAE